MANQQGLSLIELLLVILVISLVAVAAFFLYQSVQERSGAHHDQTVLRAMAIQLQQTFGPTYSAPQGHFPMTSYFYNVLPKTLADPACDPSNQQCMPQLGYQRWPIGVIEAGYPISGHGFSLVMQVMTPQDCEALLGGGTVAVGALGVSPVDGNGIASPFNTPLKGGADVVNFCESQATDGGIIDQLVLNYTLGGQPF